MLIQQTLLPHLLNVRWGHQKVGGQLQITVVLHHACKLEVLHAQRQQTAQRKGSFPHAAVSAHVCVCVCACARTPRNCIELQVHTSKEFLYFTMQRNICTPRRSELNSLSIKGRAYVQAGDCASMEIPMHVRQRDHNTLQASR